MVRAVASTIMFKKEGDVLKRIEHYAACRRKEKWQHTRDFRVERPAPPPHGLITHLDTTLLLKSPSPLRDLQIGEGRPRALQYNPVQAFTWSASRGLFRS